MIFSPTNYATGATTDAALQQIREQVVPYSQYWWRRRPTASGYSEARVVSSTDGYSNKTAGRSSSDATYYYVSAHTTYDPSEGDSTDSYATLQYANSISINQSTGAVTLNSPSTYAVTESDDVTSSSFYTRFQGKYVKGFIGCTDIVFYIPSSLSMTYHSWSIQNTGEYISYYGYEFTADSGNYQPMRVTTVKNTSTGSWETVSSSAPDAYPKTGTSGGYDWVYVGQVSDLVGRVPDSARAQWKTVNITTASFSGKTATITIPCKMALVIVPGSSSKSRASVFGVIDTATGTFYGLARDSQEFSTDVYTDIKVATTSRVCSLIYGSSSFTQLNSQVGGFNIYRDATTVSVSLTLHYLPLDSLEEGK